MTEPIIICPNYKTEIKLTKLLALRAQEFTSRNDFSDYERVLAQLHEKGAFLESHEGRLHMPERAVAT
jgi:hypothetical protein